ncbi:hypothetical protein HID58_017132 [Brassica napus]|uniref:Uncharacterized protein n=1 Tax=Brassica napus TaxID=3708 RepID=A0ABQ8D8Z7_BRANA|nr:hypothetical protein HID58_017132 [Brassica napus]
MIKLKPLLPPQVGK